MAPKFGDAGGKSPDGRSLGKSQTFSDALETVGALSHAFISLTVEDTFYRVFALC